MDTVTLTGRGGDAAGLTALRNSRDEQAIERLKAQKLARTVGSQEQLEKKVRQVSEEFVSVFMNEVMKSMRATVHETKEFHGDNGEKFFQEMLDTEQSKQLAQGSGYGLTDLIYQSLMSQYRVSTPGGGAAADDSFYSGGKSAGKVEAKRELAVAGIGG